jgi:hypothetical protein
MFTKVTPQIDTRPKIEKERKEVGGCQPHQPLIDGWVPRPH